MNLKELEAYQRDYYHKNIDKCRGKGRERAARQRTHSERRIEMNRQARIYRARIKLEVLTHYGNGSAKCVICGEDRMPCLSLDHINGNGNAHRRALDKWGYEYYYWLKQQDYPEGYQTLCMNCNFMKRVENKEFPLQVGELFGK